MVSQAVASALGRPRDETEATAAAATAAARASVAASLLSCWQGGVLHASRSMAPSEREGAGHLIPTVLIAITVAELDDELLLSTGAGGGWNSCSAAWIEDSRGKRRNGCSVGGASGASEEDCFGGDCHRIMLPSLPMLWVHLTGILGEATDETALTGGLTSGTACSLLISADLVLCGGEAHEVSAGTTY